MIALFTLISDTYILRSENINLMHTVLVMHTLNESDIYCSNYYDNGEIVSLMLIHLTESVI